MSGSRRDPHKAKLRRERIRRLRRITPSDAHPFASERSLREIQALLEGQKFESAEDIR